MAGSGDGIRLAVKDLIDVASVPTTAGSRALAATAAAAERDAPCLAGARAAGVRIVGKANLNELAYGASGVNEGFGAPGQSARSRPGSRRIIERIGGRGGG